MRLVLSAIFYIIGMLVLWEKYHCCIISQQSTVLLASPPSTISSSWYQTFAGARPVTNKKRQGFYKKLSTVPVSCAVENSL